MVEPVTALLMGRGHPIVRARDAGLATETDQVLIDYALARRLVVVTFDRDFRSAVLRSGCRCLHILPPERSARQRLTAHYRETIRLLSGTARLVSLPADGPPQGGSGRRRR